MLLKEYGIGADCLLSKKAELIELLKYHVIPGVAVKASKCTLMPHMNTLSRW